MFFSVFGRVHALGVSSPKWSEEGQGQHKGRDRNGYSQPLSEVMEW